MAVFTERHGANKTRQIKFICQCGEVFKKRELIFEHIAISNVRWPRSHPDDKHSIKEIKR